MEAGAINSEDTESNQPIHIVKNETQNKWGRRVDVMDDSSSARFGKSQGIRMYKRMKHGRSNSGNKFTENGRISVEYASHSGSQVPVACEFGCQRPHFEERPIPVGIHCTDKLPEVVSGPSDESEYDNATMRCQHVLSNVLASDEFASLTKLLTGNLQDIKVESLLSTTLIATRMKDGLYEHSPVLFSTDIQEVWKKLQSIGNEMASLSRKLSELSRTSYAEQFHYRETESRPEAIKLRNDGIFDVCKLCGEKAVVRDCIACDHCEDMYHVTCVGPVGRDIPKKNWYCLNCTSKGIGSAHEGCVVCENLIRIERNDGNSDIITACEDESNGMEGNSSCNGDGHGMEDSGICRLCGIEAEKGGRFITCDHPYCPHKYYHIRCLKSKQIKFHGTLWYCPSCLCRNCQIDKDDDELVLCDGCDDAYHIYCMSPRLDSVPRGKWFCVACEPAIQKLCRVRKEFEKRVGEEKSGERGRKDAKFGGMDMLINAANTLKDQEQISSTHLQIDA